MTSEDIKKINKKNVESIRDFTDPLKHVVRCSFWLPEAESLKQEKGEFLKYFTLPGKFALDILHFGEKGILKKINRGYPGVRFCDNNPGNYTEAVKRLGQTIGMMKNFESVVLDNEPNFWEGFPYDIYNLDFCGTCFPDSQAPFSDTLKSIKKIIKKHSDEESFPFLIFFTMKSLKSETHHQTISELKDNITLNRQNENFTSQIDQTIPDLNNFVNNEFDKFIIISIPKLICHFSKEDCDVEIKARLKYKRTNSLGQEYFITKFIFKFTKRLPTVSINNENYNSNILWLMNLEDVKEITDADITEEVTSSHTDLQEYIESLKD